MLDTKSAYSELPGLDFRSKIGDSCLCDTVLVEGNLEEILIAQIIAEYPQPLVCDAVHTQLNLQNVRIFPNQRSERSKNIVVDSRSC